MFDHVTLCVSVSGVDIQVAVPSPVPLAAADHRS